MVLAPSFRFGSSRTTFNAFLTLYLCPITFLYFFFLFNFSMFFNTKMLICFRSSCIDCCILLFDQGSFTAFPLLWFGFKPTILPTMTSHTLINLLVSVILLDLISFRPAFYSHCPVFE